MKPQTIVRPQAALALIEAARRSASDWMSWAQHLTEAARHFFGQEAVGVSVVERELTGYRPIHLELPLSADFHQREFWNLHQHFSLSQVEQIYAAQRVESLQDVFARARSLPELIDFGNRLLGRIGMHDGIAMTSRTGRVHIAVYTFLPDVVNASAKELEILTRVGLHIEHAVRLRLNQTQELAVIRPDGKILHAEGPLREKDKHSPLSEQVRAIEQALAHPSPDAARVWTGLANGRYGLSPRQDAGQRHYLVFEHTEPEAAIVQLSPREMRVAELGAQGLSNKMTAYALGLSEPTISRILASAAIKLGCTSVPDLIATVSLLLRAPSEPIPWLIPPTRAEHDVLRLVRHGFSNSEIARARSSTPRTVANQVASLLKKAHANSRRDLMRIRSG